MVGKCVVCVYCLAYDRELCMVFVLCIMTGPPEYIHPHYQQTCHHLLWIIQEPKPGKTKRDLIQIYSFTNYLKTRRLTAGIYCLQ